MSDALYICDHANRLPGCGNCDAALPHEPTGACVHYYYCSKADYDVRCVPWVPWVHDAWEGEREIEKIELPKELFRI